MPRKRLFGELELAILNIVKTHTRISVREVHALLGGKDSYTTIMTVMSRLAEKKELHRERVGQHYEYWAVDEQKSQKLSLVNRLKQKIFGGKATAMISYLIESSQDITPEELEEMEEMIAKAKKDNKDKL
jgi:BlaI family transcriptional regulator, penicillinase repressor